MFTNLTKAAIATAIIPFDIVADIVTLPASAYDSKDAWCSTEKRLNQASDALDAALK